MGASPRSAAPKSRSKPGRGRSRPKSPSRARRGFRVPAPSRLTRAERRFLEEMARATTVKAQSVTPPPALPAPKGPLHIVMVGWEFPPDHSGGLGVHSYEMVRELAQLGQKVTFLLPEDRPHLDVPGVDFRAPGDARDQPMPPGVQPLRAYVSPETGTITNLTEVADFYNVWIAGLSNLGPVDVVHVHDWFGTVGGTALARRQHAALVVTIHSTEYDRSLDHPWPEILRREEYGVARADRIIAVSRHLRAQLIDRYRAPPGRVRVVYNAVRPAGPAAAPDHGPPTVIYIGRLAAMKGVDTFLKAAARVAPSFPAVQFVVGGEGPELPHLLQLAASLGIADRVMFLGRVSEAERTHLLSHASVFVLPSVVEPFGIAALEAMAAGTPTIVSKTSGVAEISANLFRVDFWDVEEFANRIAELLLYPLLSRTLGSQGREDALRAGWRERALETLRVYREAMHDRRTP
ncbi:MAG: glycosyltransferase family 4 protein [Thermoplasmata archaeon]